MAHREEQRTIYWRSRQHKAPRRNRRRQQDDRKPLQDAKGGVSATDKKRQIIEFLSLAVRRNDTRSRLGQERLRRRDLRWFRNEEDAKQCPSTHRQGATAGRPPGRKHRPDTRSRTATVVPQRPRIKREVHHQTSAARTSASGDERPNAHTSIRVSPLVHIPLLCVVLLESALLYEDQIPAPKRG